MNTCSLPRDYNSYLSWPTPYPLRYMNYVVLYYPSGSSIISRQAFDAGTTNQDSRIVSDDFSNASSDPLRCLAWATHALAEYSPDDPDLGGAANLLLAEPACDTLSYLCRVWIPSPVLMQLPISYNDG